MNESFEHFFNALRKIRLSGRERTHMRNFLVAFISEHPVKQSFLVRVARRFESFFAYLESWNITSEIAIHPVLASFALVFFVSIGTSFAAERALPGEALYALKTRVNEPVQGALALSPVSRAEWNASLATRRLEEIEELAASGKATPENASIVASGLLAATTQFDENVSLLQENEHSTEIADAQSNLEASLHAHERVLTEISQSSLSLSSVLPIVSMVRDRAEGASRARESAESIVIQQNDDNTRVAAIRQRKKARGRLDSARALAVQPVVRTAALMAQATSTDPIEDAETTFEKGDSDLKKGHFGEAFGAFQASIRTTDENQTHSSAEHKFRQSLTPSDSEEKLKINLQGDSSGKNTHED